MTKTNKLNDVSIAEYQALAEFRYHLRLFLCFSEQVAREAGIEPQQHQLLLAVKGFPGGGEVSVGDLAERLSLRHHSAVELVDRAEEHGLVSRRRPGEGEDRRRVVVELTDEGERVLHEISLHNRAELQSRSHALVEALARLTADDERIEDANNKLEQ
jgi:DNA-binding MarR family transcriptional regulator